MRKSVRQANITLLLGAILCWTIAAASTASALGEPSTLLARPVDPLQTWSLFRYANTPAASEADRFREAGDRHDAALMDLIADQPIATWFTKYSLHMRREVAALTKAAAQRHAAAVIVAYDIPGQGCSIGASDRGAHTTAEYLAWIRAMAAGIGPRDTIVIVEPDALPFTLLGCPIKLSTLRKAVEVLVRAPGAKVYIDAGNPSWKWVRPVSEIANALRGADVRHAAGFSVNTSNFQTNAASIEYGHTISKLLGGSHFVIDTSRNGNGPDTNPADAPLWCNPPGRALGTPPTTETHVPLLDAYLWIKPPGASDETCRKGEPAGGQWWQHYALELAANSLADR